MHEPASRLHTIDDLVAYYHHVNWEQNLYVGLEWERSGVYREGLTPVPYDGEQGYRAILAKLVEEAGWDVVDAEGDNIYELQRGETRVTVEGDGRLELAGSPREILHDLARELRLHNNEVEEMGNIFGIAWLSLGVQPLHGNEDISLLPKERYQLFKGIGDPDLMATMTKRNNGVTANLSYIDEENAVRKAQAAFRVLPIVSAIFASSPFDAGSLSPYLDYRRHVIQHHAPERTGIPSTILDEGFSFRSWLQHYVDLPVVLIERGDTYQRPARALTFAQWMHEGYEGVFPTYRDFDRHVKTTWSDIRLRPSYLEYRVPDSVPFRFIMSVPALMKGLVFDSASWEQIEQLTADWTYDDILDLDRRAWTTGLQTDMRGRPLLSYAQEIITIANEKLHGFERTDGSEQDESIYLADLKEQIFIREKSPAEELRDLYEGSWNGDLSRIVEWCEQSGRSE